MPESRDIGIVQRSTARRVFDLRESSIIAAVGVLMTIVITLGYARSLGAAYAVEHVDDGAGGADSGQRGVTIALGGLRDRVGVISVAVTLTWRSC